MNFLIFEELITSDNQVNFKTYEVDQTKKQFVIKQTAYLAFIYNKKSLPDKPNRDS